MSTAHRAALTIALGCGLAACNSEKVTWSFVSNPGADGGFDNRAGGATIVIRRNRVRSATWTGDATRIAGSDRSGALTVYLPHGQDLAVLERPSSIELRSPLVPGRRIALDGASARSLPDLPAVALELQLPDASSLVATRPGPATLFVPSAAHGNLLVVSFRNAVVELTANGRTIDHGDGSLLDPRGQDLILMKNGRRTILRGSPTVDSSAQLRFDPRRDSVAILGPFGRRQAEVPRTGTRLHNGQAGLLLTADFPNGLNDRQRAPLSLLVAAGNRYLLRISP